MINQLTITPRPELVVCPDVRRPTKIGVTEAVITGPKATLRLLAFKCDRCEGLVFRYDVFLTPHSNHYGTTPRYVGQGEGGILVRNLLTDGVGLDPAETTLVFDTVNNVCAFHAERDLAAAKVFPPVSPALSKVIDEADAAGLLDG